jgi:hypothetical protein
MEEVSYDVRSADRLVVRSLPNTIPVYWSLKERFAVSRVVFLRGIM